VDAACVTLGNGSNDILELLARAFLTPADEAVFSEHAFAVYPIVVQAVGATARIAPARDFGHDLGAMRALVNAKTRLVFVANPNNPTGTWLDGVALEAFIGDLPAHVIAVVDEAYFEYVRETGYPDASQWLDRYPNLVVTRTFSKAYGLAGLRIGYGLSHPEVADLLNRVRQPFNTNAIAQAAALAALADDAHIAASVRNNADGMRQYVQCCERHNRRYIPSVGNFLCIHVGDAAAINEGLLRAGVIVRPVANYGLPDYLRITIGRPEENARCIAALEDLLGGVSHTKR
jgi:histidinol-phosphate aminotransferase